MLAQRIEEKFYTFEIKHTQRSENRYTNALAALGSQIAFEGSSTTREVKKQKESRIEILEENFPERERSGKDWRASIKEAQLKEDVAELKAVKDYVLMKGELYRRM